jgi:hypothetical protein
MSEVLIRRLSELLRERNATDAAIGQITSGSVADRHVAHWVASQIFDIQPEAPGPASELTGRFQSSALEGHTVSVQWHRLQRGLLDTAETTTFEYYLVLAGPPPLTPPTYTRQPLSVDSVYLFHARQLHAEQNARGVRPGLSSIVTATQWRAAEIYPSARNTVLLVTPVQAAQLQLFRIT